MFCLLSGNQALLPVFFAGRNVSSSVVAFFFLSALKGAEKKLLPFHIFCKDIIH